MEKEASIVESILFLESEPADLAKLTKISRLTDEIVLAALDLLKIKYQREDSGLELAEISGGFTLIPKLELWEDLKSIYGKKTDEKMTRATLETLSIIAYSQPLTKAEVDSIRGVNSSGILKILLERDMIKEVGRKEGPGKPVQYGTTKEFLRYFKLNSIADLPKLDENEREKFELDANE